MFATTIKGVLANKRRLLSTALAITLGVAFLAGTLIFTDTVGRTVDSLFARFYQTTDAVVRADKAFTGPQGAGDQRPRLDAATLTTVRAVDGVAAAEGRVEGYARVVDKHGDAIGNPANGGQTTGMSWIGDPRLNGWSLASGAPPTTAGQVVLDKKTATSAGYRVGDTATILVNDGPRQFTVSGIARFGNTDTLANGSYALFTLPAAQQYVGEPGKLDSIAVAAAPHVTQAELAAHIQARLPANVEAVTGAAIITESQSTVRRALRPFTQFLLVFAVVALVVGAFMIFNTFSITVAQRTKENALLRALGASRRQVLGSVLLEALAVSVLGAVVGLCAGALIALSLKWMLSAFGMLGLPLGGLVFTPATAIRAGAAGILIALIAATSPARNAAKAPPIAAMHDVATATSGYGSKQRVIVGVLVLAGGVTAVLAGLFGTRTNQGLVGAGALLTFLGVSVLGRTIALPLSRVISSPLPRLRGETGEIARQNAMRNPKRTAASAAALMVGVGLVSAMTILASSTKASANHIIEQTVRGDYIISSGGGLSGGVSPELASTLAKLPQVGAATGIPLTLAEVNGTVVTLGGIDPRGGFDLLDVQVQQGTPAAIAEPGTIAVYTSTARDKHLHLGDPVTVVFKDTGRQTLRVALIYGRSQGIGSYFLGLPTFQQNVASRLDAQLFVRRAPGVSLADGLTAVKAAAAPYAGATVMDISGYKASQAAQVNQMLGLTYALLALAIVIALIGIANTLGLSIHERTRELGLLRAVGMTRRQLRGAIRWESVIIALQGTVLGLGIGVFFGWAITAAFKETITAVFVIPYTTLVMIVVLAALAGVLAAALPGRRAARLDVLKAVVTE